MNQVFLSRYIAARLKEFIESNWEIFKAEMDDPDREEICTALGIEEDDEAGT